MKLEVYPATTFKEYLEVLNTVNEEPMIELNPQGIHSIMMDPKHVYMCELTLPDSFFDIWEIEENEKIQVNLPAILKALNKVTKKENLRFNYTYKLGPKLDGSPQEKENECIELSLISDYTRRKTVECLDLLEEETPSPRIYFKNKARLTIDIFKRILEDFNGNSEHITIEGINDSIQFKTDSDTYRDFVELDKHNDHILELYNEENSKTTYTINCILPFIKKAQKIAEVITLEYTQDMPLKIDVELPQGTLIFYVAPCIGV